MHYIKRWKLWLFGSVGFFMICGLVWWIVMSFCVKLESHHQRVGNKYSLNTVEKEEIRKDTRGMNTNSIVEYAMKRTCANLNFKMKPTYAMSSGEGNCITYAAMFAAIANEGFSSNGINAHASHDVGTLKLFNIDLCNYAGQYGGGFFTDHDFVTITAGTVSYSIDPSLKDIIGFDLKTSIK